MPYEFYADAHGMVSMDEYNDSKAIAKTKTRIWFLNKDLVRVYHKDRGGGVITVFNITQDRLQTILLDEWFKKRQKAYSVRETGYLLNRHPKYIAGLVKRGSIPPPLGAKPGGRRAIRVRSYYSEDQVYELRDYFASKSWGRPRKDGLITNNHTPTRQELTRRMGKGILLYTKTEDGRVIPIWSETI